MDFHLTREQELVRQMMHDFTENEVKPIAAETDKTSTYPRENIHRRYPRYPQWSVLRPDHCKRYSRTEGEVPPHADRRPQGRCFRTDRAGRWF